MCALAQTKTYCCDGMAAYFTIKVPTCRTSSEIHGNLTTYAGLSTPAPPPRLPPAASVEWHDMVASLPRHRRGRSRGSKHDQQVSR